MKNKIKEIAKQNALKYSEKICQPIEKYSYAFPEYFDWSDHIATKKTQEYAYHLNKIVDDIEKILAIFIHKVNKWQGLNKIILPVEIANNKIREIQL